MSTMEDLAKHHEDRPSGCRPRAILTLVGGVLVHLALGSYYTFGNMAPYIISYLRLKSDEPWIKNVDSLWISTIGTLPGPIALIIGGAIEKNFGARIALAIGCLIYSAGSALTYFSIKESLALVTISYGACVSLGSFIAYGIPIQAAARWFPNHQTLVIGIILCGFGGSTLIMNQVITGYINPKNLSPDFETSDGEKYFTDEELLDRVPYVFLILAGVYIGLAIVGVAMISQPPDEMEIVNEAPTYVKISDDLDETEPLLAKDNSTSDSLYKEAVTKHMSQSFRNNKIECNGTKERQPIIKVIKTLLKNKNSYVIAAVMFFIFAGMQFNISLYKAYGQTFISDDKFLALVGSIAAVFNCICRPFWGFVMDKYGFQLYSDGWSTLQWNPGISLTSTTITSFSSLQHRSTIINPLITTKILATSFVCIMTTLSLTEKLGKAAFMIWICASYGSFCGIFPIGPSTLAKLFGKDNMVINMSFTFLFTTAATLFGGFSGLILKDSIGWHGLFLLSGCLGVMAFFVSFFFDGKDENGKEI